MVDFQSYAGPGDKGLRNTELEGYQPVSRIGEVVMVSFAQLKRPRPTFTSRFSLPTTRSLAVFAELFR
jgi:hypothetical protein